MALLQDPVILARYKSALANWKVTDYITWKDLPVEWVRKNLPELEPRAIGRLMFQHVAAGGEIDQIPKRRPEWNVYDFHYDLRIRIDKRLIYIETLLIDDDPDDPIIHVVNIHDA
jgi:hypothetical protein